MCFFVFPIFVCVAAVCGVRALVSPHAGYGLASAALVSSCILCYSGPDPAPPPPRYVRLARRTRFYICWQVCPLRSSPVPSRPVRARAAAPRATPRARIHLHSDFSSKVTSLARKHTRQSLRVARASPPCPRRAVQTTRSHIAPRWALRSLGSRLAML